MINSDDDESSRIGPCEKALGQLARWALPGPRRLVWLSLSVLLCVLPAFAQSQQPPNDPGAGSSRPDAPATATSVDVDLPGRQLPGSMSGIIVDETGAAIVGSQVRLTRGDQSKFQEVVSVTTANSHLKISLPDRSSSRWYRRDSRRSHSRERFIGRDFRCPADQAADCAKFTVVRVGLTKTEVAEVQIKAEEKQRGAWIHAEFLRQLSPRPRSAELETKIRAGVEDDGESRQLRYRRSHCGSSAGRQQFQRLWARRAGLRRSVAYGAAYADFVSGTFIIGAAIFPSLLKQEPHVTSIRELAVSHRGFCVRTGERGVCKGDNGH